MKKNSLPIIVVMILFFVFGSASGIEKKVNSTAIKTIDGIPHVLNPSSPLNGELELELETVMEIDSDLVAPGNPITFSVSVKADNGCTYIGDMNEAKIYAFDKKGKLIASFLGKGEGPAEVIFSFSSIKPLHNHVWILSTRKFIKFSQDGKYMGDRVFGKKKFYDSILLDENRFFGKFSVIDKNERDKSKWKKWSIALMDGNQNVLKTYYESRTPHITIIDKKLDGNPVRFFLNLDSLTPAVIFQVDLEKELLYYCESAKYEIMVMDFSGKLQKVIGKENRRIMLKQEELAEVASQIITKENLKLKNIVMGSLPKEFCPISKIQILPRGYLAISRKISLKEYIIDIFDPNGVYIYQLKFPGGIKDHRVCFNDRTVSIIETVDDRDVYREYLIKNLPGIFD